MSLTILQVAYPFASVGRDSVGGAEQVLTACDEAVVRAGHHSIVVACEGSIAAGELMSVPSIARVDDPRARAAVHAGYRKAIEPAIARYRVDLVHCHGIDFQAYFPAEPVNVLVTLHLAASLYDAAALKLDRAGTYFNCVSKTQHASCPTMRHLLPPIINGIDTVRLRPDPQARRSHALILARICPEKGIHLAIDAAKQAGIDLVIAGEIFSYSDHERYFAEEVRPRLDARRVFAGPVGFEVKRKLLQSARCLLIPSLIEETSSLVAMESLACGTPVIASRRGALPEIVEDGVTGVLVDSVDAMAAAIGKVDTVEASACVAAARERFNVARMACDYINLYERLSSGRRASRHNERIAS